MPCLKLKDCFFGSLQTTVTQADRGRQRARAQFQQLTANHEEVFCCHGGVLNCLILPLNKS